ncbi:2624_t:CDS:1, partial [Gigaspora rosea]
NCLNITKFEDINAIHSYYISNVDTELAHATVDLELDELQQKY